VNSYVARRLLAAVPTVCLVAFLSFGLMRLQPGDVILAQIGAATAGGGGTANVSPERLNQLRHQLGLYGSVPEQFARWVGGIARGNFGKSWLTNQSTLAQFVRRAPLTIQLGILAVLFSMLIGIPLGAISAIWNDSLPDYIARLIAISALAIPNFFLAIMVVIALSRFFGWSPVTSNVTPWDDPGTWAREFLFPAFTLAFASAGVVVRLVRTSLLEVLRQDYIRTAKAKGLSDTSVVVRHALKNAMIPVATLIGAQLTYIIAGSVVIEQIFNLRGVGSLTYTAIQQRDYVQLQTNVVIFSLVLVLGNLLTDLSYGWLDPRISNR
jgi:peptide/nickel transport system permease protein